MARIKFASENFYHVYNRGTDKRKIFLDDSDYWRFLISMRLMNDEKDGLMIQWRDYKITNPDANLETFLRCHLRERKPLVEFVCFSLLPNHYHFILKQISEKGISEFMRRIGIAHTMYFNEKYKRTGVLFQGTFKASEIRPNNFLYLSVYVNCNAEVHGIAKAENYRWSSYQEYIREGKRGLCAIGKKVILDNFQSGEDYEKFARVNINYYREKKQDDKMFLENLT
jgi:putative transposase